MTIHDWSRVGDGTFHDFHNGWIIHLKEALNEGRLPKGYYAQSEQHVGRKIADVLALHASNPDEPRNPPRPAGDRAVALKESPPRVSRTHQVKRSGARRRKTLTIRHSSGHRIIALVEIVSPANKATASALGEFVRKVDEALRVGIHVVVIDVLPRGKHDPQGMHAAVLEALGDEDDELPLDKPLTFASYVGEPDPIAYLEPAAIGDTVPDMPMFLTSDYYVELPLAASYAAAFRGMPEYWREVLEAKG